MKRIFLLPTVLLAAATLGLFGGCAGEQSGLRPRVEVDSDPPPIRQEAITTSPGPEFIWVDGSWAWNGQWVWEPGRWDHPPHVGAVWVPNRFVNHDGKRIFIRGGWQ